MSSSLKLANGTIMSSNNNYTTFTCDICIAYKETKMLAPIDNASHNFRGN